jgi:very-short-patch-repair endonuclease/endogenous inhibitor of DNA gyrase (YacG/DUF329 family)
VYPSQASRQWCSAACRYATPGWQDACKPGQRKDVACLICGKVVSRPLSATNSKYCSYHCLGIANGARQERNPDARREYTCEECGKTFIHWKSVSYRKRFCSRSCVATWTGRHRHILRPTSIETALAAAFATHGIEVVREYRFGFFCLDFAIPDRKIAIEADGDYWHSIAKQVFADARKDATLKAAGWRIFRFTETQINASPEQCAEQVAASL